MLILSCGSWKSLVVSPAMALFFEPQNWSLLIYDLNGKTVLLIETLAETGTAFGETTELYPTDL